MSIRDDVALALQLADRADALTLDRFGALDLRIETKPDLTPVTDADRSAEELLRDLLAEHRPDDAVLGEEYGGTAAFLVSGGATTDGDAQAGAPVLSIFSVGAVLLLVLTGIGPE